MLWLHPIINFKSLKLSHILHQGDSLEPLNAMQNLENIYILVNEIYLRFGQLGFSRNHIGKILREITLEQ